MRACVINGCVIGTLLVAAVACDENEKGGESDKAAAPSAAEPPKPEKPPEPEPRGCQASGDKAVELKQVVGDVYGFAEDGAWLYYTSWDLYGNRGNLGRVRKDGQGARTLGSLELEPRGLALGKDDIFYTAGIQLMRAAKDGDGKIEALDPKFSAQAIALHGDRVYGVPGDYGPYDRVASLPMKGGTTKELATSDRPSRDRPNGFSSVAVESSGIFVTDTGRDRVLRYTLEGGKPKVIAAHQDRPYDLAVVGDAAYFTLAKKGRLMRVGVDGGPVEEVAKGLVEMARIAGDGKAMYSISVGDGEDAPNHVVEVAEGKMKPVSKVPAGETVRAMGLDGDCVYWTQRVDASTTRVMARAR